MSTNKKAPGSFDGTAQGAKKNAYSHFVPFPIERVNGVSPRLLRRIQSSTIDRIAAAGWPWDQPASLFVDEAQIWIEVARDVAQRRLHNEQY